MSGIFKAAEAVNGQRRLALQLGVSQQAVNQWVLQGWAPLGRARQIERLTGVPARELVDPSIKELFENEGA